MFARVAPLIRVAWKPAAVAAVAAATAGLVQAERPAPASIKLPPALEGSIKSKIGAYPDFPQPGILFRDIFPLLASPLEFEYLCTVLQLNMRVNHQKIDAVIGLDARGFLFGPTLAMGLGCAFVPVRKSGKLPGEVYNVSYEKEYGKDSFEMQTYGIKPGMKVVIVDDLMATGGTMQAAVTLARKAGAEVLGCYTLIELVDLQGYKKVDAPCYTVLKY